MCLSLSCLWSVPQAGTLKQQHLSDQAKTERPLSKPCSSSFHHRLPLFLPRLFGHVLMRAMSVPSARSGPTEFSLATSVRSIRSPSRKQSHAISEPGEGEKAPEIRFGIGYFWTRDLLLGSTAERAGPSNEAPGCRSAAHPTLAHSLPRVGLPGHSGSQYSFGKRF